VRPGRTSAPYKYRKKSCPPFPPGPVLMSTQPLLQRTANKRIALPVRVEPKVAFANERTFLSWLHFTVILGGLAVGLLNFGDKASTLSRSSWLNFFNVSVQVGKISAAMFSFVGPYTFTPASVTKINNRNSHRNHELCIVYLSLACAIHPQGR
jgi:uncharacterized membrane protein YidH (DUF202 family)